MDFCMKIFIVLTIALHKTSLAIIQNRLANVDTEGDIIMGPDCIWIANDTCPSKYLKFYLYTGSTMNESQLLKVGKSLQESSIPSSGFNVSVPTKIIIHGYNSGVNDPDLVEMGKEYLSKGVYNLIYVDWSILTMEPCYIYILHNMDHVGECVSQLVQQIVEMGAIDIHIIGFSVGAHLMNFIALNLKEFKVPRMTGLDPAMPFFISLPIEEKLDPSDAVFVDIIHTNVFLMDQFLTYGHADFYMNGGLYQPGCPQESVTLCSHQRAVQYFTESIQSTKGFWGWKCPSYVAYLLGHCQPSESLYPAGDPADIYTKGIFFVTTATKSPFALGKWTDLPKKDNRELYSRSSIKHGPFLHVGVWDKIGWDTSDSYSDYSNHDDYEYNDDN